MMPTTNLQLKQPNGNLRFTKFKSHINVTRGDDSKKHQHFFIFISIEREWTRNVCYAARQQKAVWDSTWEDNTGIGRARGKIIRQRCHEATNSPQNAHDQLHTDFFFLLFKMTKTLQFQCHVVSTVLLIS